LRNKSTLHTGRRRALNATIFNGSPSPPKILENNSFKMADNPSAE
jgi:hypothetical protein